MGQGLSCRVTFEHVFFSAIQQGDLSLVQTLIERRPRLLNETTLYDRSSPLHIAAANGRITVLAWLLERGLRPDVYNRHKQTPLMMAAMYGKVSCAEKLLQGGANVLLFDSLHGRTCLHYAANFGHQDCIQVILAAAQISPIADTWGFARFVNVRDGDGATPLHLAARTKHHEAIRLLLRNGALVCATTGADGRPGSTPLHLAARSGSLECVRELLAWGADRFMRDSSGRIPYAVALKYKYSSCAALLNPGSAEPLVWPSAWKFISQLNPEAKILLENALMEANRAREKNILFGSDASEACIDQDFDDDGNDTLSEGSESEVCCICFDQLCTIEVQNCGHQMCALCTLALCCHSKPNSSAVSSIPPACPFCRSNIAQLAVIPPKEKSLDIEPSKVTKPRQSRSFSEGSSSFKGLSAKGSFSRLSVKGSGKIADSSEWLEKLES